MKYDKIKERNKTIDVPSQSVIGEDSKSEYDEHKFHPKMWEICKFDAKQ